MIIEGRLPSIDEVRAAIVSPLLESYWFFEGWNFNRPVIAQVGIGVRLTNGPYVWVRFFGDGYIDQWEEVGLLSIDLKLKFTGPIIYGEQEGGSK